MLAAWLLRELSYDLVEHCAAARSASAPPWTGHGAAISASATPPGSAWCPTSSTTPRSSTPGSRLRELPAGRGAVARSPDPADPDVAPCARCWTGRSRYLAEQADLHRLPILSRSATLALQLSTAPRLLDEFAEHGTHAEAPHAAAVARTCTSRRGEQGRKCRGRGRLGAHRADRDLDDAVEAGLRCEKRGGRPRMRCGELREMIGTDYPLGAPSSTSPTPGRPSTSGTPRSTTRSRGAPYAGPRPGRTCEHAVDIARAVHALHDGPRRRRTRETR